MYRTTRIGTQETYATKIVNIAQMKKTSGKDHKRALATLHDEITALKILRGGPHIVRLIDVFEDPQNVHIVMEEMKGGDLLTRICKKEVYNEREARKVSRFVFEALDYCHKKKIAHRDIKPDNILLKVSFLSRPASKAMKLILWMSLCRESNPILASRLRTLDLPSASRSLIRCIHFVAHPTMSLQKWSTSNPTMSA